MKNRYKISALLCGMFLVLSLFAAGTVFSGGLGTGETETVLIMDGEEKLETFKMSSEIEVIEDYGTNILVELPKKRLSELEGKYRINRLEKRNKLNVKGHKFVTDKGYPDFDSKMMIDEYGSGEQGLYIVDMKGPVSPDWREKLENIGVDIINYVPNYAYEVRMTPEQADHVEKLEFVDWTGIYQPGFKVGENLEPGLVKIKMADGREIIDQVQHKAEIIKIARNKDVYYVSDYQEPHLMSEMGSQIIGGGAWVYDDDNDPSTPYRAEGDYGAYVNQLGYEGTGVVMGIADTGLGDGTTPDAGHNDFTGRVIGGHDFSGNGNWHDGHGHGTQCAGLMAGDTYDGNGVQYAGHGPYYVSQGLASDSDVYAQKIFADDGSWVGPSDYYQIPQNAKQNASTYVHSNSWGSSSEGSYEDSDEAYDKAVRDADSDSSGNQPMVLVVAAGNDGEDDNPMFPGRVENSIGSPGNAKNILTIGASETYMPDAESYGNDYSSTDNPDNVAGFSSKGWTDDGRVKPTLAAPGHTTLATSTPDEGGANLYGLYSEDSRYEWCSGTSQATPTAAGAASVVVEYYKDTYGTRPSPAMVKALMINTAYDMPNDHDGDGSTDYIPNKDEGWGLINLVPIVDPPTNFMLEDQTSLLTTGETDTYNIEYSDSSEPLKITLDWTDKNALSGDSKTLKNDLNLKVTSPSGKTYYGNAFSEGWTPANTASNFDDNGDNYDDTNVVENVYIPSENLESGEYTVEVIGYDIPADANNDGTANQDYALAMYNAQSSSGDTNSAPSVDLTRPDGGETFEPGTTETIWWNMSDSEDANTDLTCYLNYSTDGGSSWNAIDTVAGTSNPNTYDWTVPDEESSDCLVNIDVVDTGGAKTSDQSSSTFTISNITGPSINITRPSGGETWNAGDVEEITWDTTAGDGSITGVDLEYSVDDGASWNWIVEGTEDDGSYNWTVPDNDTNQARIRATVNDDNGLSGEDVSDQFTINGTSGDSAPEINTFQLTDQSNPQWSKVEVDWGVSDSDGDLDSVKIEMVDSNGNVVDSVTNSVSGDSASGTDSLRDRSSGGTYDIVITVTDAAGNTTQQTKTIEL